MRTVTPRSFLDRYVEDVKMSRSLTEENLPLIAIIPVEGTLMPGDSEEGMAGSDRSTAISTLLWRPKIWRLSYCV